MKRHAFVLAALLCLWPMTARAQSIELVYTPGVVKDALTLRDALKVTIVHPFDGMSLVGAPADRKRAYKEKLTGVTALVIVGEDALKAMSDIDFSDAVILINAAGPTQARGRVIRVFDGSVTVPPGTVSVPSTDLVHKLIGADREVLLRGRPLDVVVQAVIQALRRS
jgi:hypothetical protein